MTIDDIKALIVADESRTLELKATCTKNYTISIQWIYN